VAVVGIVPAAGLGERLGAAVPKALAAFEGRPLVAWSVDVLASTCERVVVAVPPGYEGHAALSSLSAATVLVAGGASRSASVRAALEAASEAEVAVVHDAARPLVTADLVRSCLSALEGFDGAVAAARVADTIKEADSEWRVVRTLERARLWAIQTPQAFRAKALRRALAVGDEELAAATDDASLVEAAGGSVRVVEAPPDNIKVTDAVDLELAALLLRARRRG
jgi:2-C-methyl-D-erythritol 4-phosphate cytidylyltransferase